MDYREFERLITDPDLAFQKAREESDENAKRLQNLQREMAEFLHANLGKRITSETKDAIYAGLNKIVQKYKLNNLRYKIIGYQNTMMVAPEDFTSYCILNNISKPINKD